MRQKTLSALFLFAILSLVLTYPLPLHLADAVEDRQDALLNVWITAWDGHQLVADPLHLFEANIFHPYPRTLAYSELLLGNALFALPITAASGNPVLGYNVALLLSFLLSALGTYLLVVRLTRSHGAGLVAGITFAFSSYRLTNVAQAQLLTTQWLPFALLAFHQLLRAPRPRPRHIVVFSLFFCLQVLSSFYYGILLALAVVGYWIFDIGYSIAGSARSRVSDPQSSISSIGSLFLAALLCAALLLPFVLPYFQVQAEMGFERTLADSEPFSASLQQYAMVPPGSVLYGGLLPSDDTPIDGGYPVDALFPGFVLLALAAWGVAAGRITRRGGRRWYFVLLAAAAFLLSLGPRLYLAPGEPAGLDMALPYAWLYAVVPGFRALRAPVRFDALVSLALAVLAGYGVAALARPRPTGGWRRWLAPALVATVAVESLVWPAAVAEPVPVAAAVPEVYRWLARQASAPLLELPMAFTPGGPQLEYQYFSTYHWHTTPDGYSGFVPPKHGQIVYEMADFPAERSVRLLQALGVRRVVVHADRYPPAAWQEMAAELAAAVDVTPVATFGDAHVYRVEPRNVGAEAIEMRAYLPPEAAAGRPYRAYALLINRGGTSYAVAPTERLQATVRWQAPGVERLDRTAGDPPLVISPGGVGVVPLPVTAPDEPGPYSAAVAVQGPTQTGVSAGGGEVRVRGNVAATPFPVPARLSAWVLSETARPGDELPVGLTWQVLGKIDAYYSVYVKLLGADGSAAASWDGQPRDGEAPTLLWVPGETVEDLVVLRVPDDLPAGDYTVEVGMYRAEDLARCLTLDDEYRPVPQVVLGTVQIAP